MGKLDTHKQKNEIGPLSPTTYKNQVKWFKDSHTGSETIKLLEEKNQGNPLDIDLGNAFLDVIPKMQVTKKKKNTKDKWD